MRLRCNISGSNHSTKMVSLLVALPPCDQSDLNLPPYDNENSSYLAHSMSYTPSPSYHENVSFSLRIGPRERLGLSRSTQNYLDSVIKSTLLTASCYDARRCLILAKVSNDGLIPVHESDRAKQYILEEVGDHLLDSVKDDIVKNTSRSLLKIISRDRPPTFKGRAARWLGLAEPHRFNPSIDELMAGLTDGSSLDKIETLVDDHQQYIIRRLGRTLREYNADSAVEAVKLYYLKALYGTKTYYNNMLLTRLRNVFVREFHKSLTDAERLIFIL